MTHTFQKRPENFADGSYPVYLERGAGAVVWDVDGQSYIDYICALGATTLGHHHPAVSNTLHERLDRGVLLSLPVPAEVAAAELLVAQVPGIDQVRFLKTGAEACAAAARLARFHTGRDRILLAGYHGWHDQLIGTSPGVPERVQALSRRTHVDSASDEQLLCDYLHRNGPDLAALVLSTPYHRPLSTQFLHEVQRLCHEHGLLLIADEIVTGFRLAPGGLSQIRGLEPDLVCFSKGLAAGMPLAAVAGPYRTMAAMGKLRVSSTFAGEVLALEVMKAVLRVYRDTDYYAQVASLGRRLREGLNQLAGSLGAPAIVAGYDALPCLRFSEDPATHTRLATRFVAEMAQRGVLLRRDVNFVSAAHQPQHIDSVLSAAEDALPRVLDTAGRGGST